MTDSIIGRYAILKGSGLSREACKLLNDELIVLRQLKGGEYVVGPRFEKVPEVVVSKNNLIMRRDDLESGYEPQGYKLEHGKAGITMLYGSAKFKD